MARSGGFFSSGRRNRFMTSLQVKVALSDGLDVRQIAEFVQLASKFESSVYLNSERAKVNAKSIMGMMAQNLDRGDEITVIADGADEEDAVNAIGAFLQGRRI